MRQILIHSLWVTMVDKISIIIPVYNCETLISRALDSLIGQTHRNIEILCVNDGSVDKSLEILEKYSAKDSRVKVFSQENSGPAKARNTGLENSSGDYIMFCDSDDWFEPQMCEKMINLMQEKDTDFVMCGAKVAMEDGYVSNRTGGWAISFHSQIPYTGKFALDTSSRLEVKPMIWGKIYKKSLIDKYNITFPTGLEHDDTIFNLQYLCVATNGFGLDEQLYNYFIRKDSIMDQFYKKNESKLYDSILIFELLNNFLKRNALSSLYEDLFIAYFVRMFRTSLRMCTNENEKDRAVKNLFNILEKTGYNYKKYVIFNDIKKLDLKSLQSKIINMSYLDFLHTKSSLFKVRLNRLKNILPILLKNQI